MARKLPSIMRRRVAGTMRPASYNRCKDKGIELVFSPFWEINLVKPKLESAIVSRPALHLDNTLSENDYAQLSCLA